MLAAAGVDFHVETADVDEAAIRSQLAQGPGATIAPEQVALTLAIAKAKAVASKRPGMLVIGADQVLALGTEIFSKPVDRNAAREQLARLKGRRHALHSAVALVRYGEVEWQGVETAELTMRDFSDAFLDSYLDAAGDEVCHSVGAYQLEGLGIQLFESIRGDYFTILGMPLLTLLGELRRRGLLSRISEKCPRGFR